MELHLLLMVWFTSLFFTLLSFYVRTNWTFPLIAAIGFIVVAMCFGEVTVFGFDSMGNAHTYDFNMGDPNTMGMVGAHYWFWGIGIVLIMLTAGWILSGKSIGEDV